MNMKKRLKYNCEVILRKVFRIVGKVIPVRQNRLLFYSFTGTQYSCNPKYITEYLLEHFPDSYEIIWAFRDRKNVGEVPKAIRCVKYQSLAFFYYHLSSKVIISNIYPFQYIGIKKEQRMIDTWHGGGAYKVGGFDFVSTKNKAAVNTYNFYQDNISVFISSSSLFSKYLIRGGMKFTGPILETGLPRNDIFFFSDEKKQKIKDKVYQSLGIEKGLKTILYAPTWRSQEEEDSFVFDTERLKEAFQERFGGEWIVVVRMHMLSKSKVKQKAVDAGGYPDMQELLVGADALITDYSSSIWDYSLTQKPCLLYTYDLEKYQSGRSFYVDIHKWGFPLAICFEDLIQCIETFDEQEFAVNMSAHQNMLGSFERGDACQKVVSYIEKETQQDRH